MNIQKSDMKISFHAESVWEPQYAHVRVRVTAEQIKNFAAAIMEHDWYAFHFVFNGVVFEATERESLKGELLMSHVEIPREGGRYVLQKREDGTYTLDIDYLRPEDVTPETFMEDVFWATPSHLIRVILGIGVH